MSPRLNLFSARSLFRSTQCASSHLARESLAQQSYKKCARTILAPSAQAQRRMNSSSSGKGEQKPEDPADVPKGPSQDQLPTVSEEAAEIHRIVDTEACGEVGAPELEQGTPVVDVSSYM